MLTSPFIKYVLSEVQVTDCDMSWSTVTPVLATVTVQVVVALFGRVTV